MSNRKAEPGDNPVNPLRVSIDPIKQLMQPSAGFERQLLLDYSESLTQVTP